MNACGVCRKQKLRCDGGSPACGRCARLGHQCMYDETRRKSGPRRGYVKGLETRLGLFSKVYFVELIRGHHSSESCRTNRAHGVTAQVETLLRQYEPVNERQSEPKPAAINMMVDDN